MRDSSKQLMIFDCASLKSVAKQAKVIPEELSLEVSSSNKVYENYSEDSNGEGVQLNMMEMPSTPSLCCTPIVIYSSSDDESTGLFVNDDDYQHATPIPSECSSVFFNSWRGFTLNR